MAGNIVKWWKHKILGGYKQFSVLQECTTDSEELIHSVRAPSSCSAPPDLLLVGERENNNTNQHQQQSNQHPNHQQHHQYHQNSHSKTSHHKDNIQKHHSHMKNSELVNRLDEPSEKNDARIHLEEFTCDVSVENGKSSQPLQFSFTFYDLDGHHGKITKDDIVGIVYTIYESIGKSVVVPHCGSKTINVRLTVSPEGKSKPSSKSKKTNITTAHNAQQQQQQQVQQQNHNTRRQHRYRPRKPIKSDDEDEDGDSSSEKETTKVPITTNKLSKSNIAGTSIDVTTTTTIANNQNQPKYYNCLRGETRPITTVHHHLQQQHNSNNHELSSSSTQPISNQTEDSPVSSSNQTSSQKQQQHPVVAPSENIYESMANLKCCSKESRKVELERCRDCVKAVATASIGHQENQQRQQQQQQHQQYLKQISARAKLLRKARKQKYQEQYYETRQRSLSVGNESCWKMRTDKTNNRDDIDGRSRTVPTTAECWNNALKRNDLIDIIRESMEKNRLCFRTNGKPQQSNISPIHHRQRSNTVISRMVTDDSTYSPALQSSHHIPIYHQQMAINPAILAVQQQNNVHMKTNLCGYDSFLHATICSSVAAASANNSQQQQNLLNTPTVPNQLSSTITATIPPTTNNHHQSSKTHHQLNPVNNSNLIKSSKISRIGTAGYHSQQNSPQFQGYNRLNSNLGYAKLNTTLLNSLNPQLSAEEKLNQTFDHVEKWLIERDQAIIEANEFRKLKNVESGEVDESKSKKDVKNYDNFLYAKLTEKLQQQQQRQLQQEQIIRKNSTTCPTSQNNNITAAASTSATLNNGKNVNSSNNNDKENIRRMHYSYNHHHHHYNHQKAHHRKNLCIANNIQTTTLPTLEDDKNNGKNGSNKFVTLIPINVDPIECENLLHLTSDEDSTTTTIPPTPSSQNDSNDIRCSGISAGDGSASAASGGDGDGDCGADGSGGGSTSDNPNVSSNGNISNSSSTVHRYVHEHIHHHYHHFENKQN